MITLERLKEIREKARFMFCEEYEVTSFDCIQIMELIDKEIAERTITDKQIEDAIGDFKQHLENRYNPDAESDLDKSTIAVSIDALKRMSANKKGKYICKAKCPELDCDFLPHCETDDPETKFAICDGCPVGNVPIWVEQK